MKLLHSSFVLLFSALTVNAFVYHRSKTILPPIGPDGHNLATLSPQNDEVPQSVNGLIRDRRQSDGGWDWNNWNSERKKREDESDDVYVLGGIGLNAEGKLTKYEQEQERHEVDMKKLAASFVENIVNGVNKVEYIEEDSPASTSTIEPESDSFPGEEDVGDEALQHKSLKKKCKRGKPNCRKPPKGNGCFKGKNGKEFCRDSRGKLIEVGTGIAVEVGNCVVAQIFGQPCIPQLPTSGGRGRGRRYDYDDYY